jgi:hypothetical protein
LDKLAMSQFHFLLVSELKLSERIEKACEDQRLKAEISDI